MYSIKYIVLRIIAIFGQSIRNNLRRRELFIKQIGMLYFFKEKRMHAAMC